MKWFRTVAFALVLPAVAPVLAGNVLVLTCDTGLMAEGLGASPEEKPPIKMSQTMSLKIRVDDDGDATFTTNSSVGQCREYEGYQQAHQYFGRCRYKPPEVGRDGYIDERFWINRETGMIKFNYEVADLSGAETKWTTSVWSGPSRKAQPKF